MGGSVNCLYKPFSRPLPLRLLKQKFGKLIVLETDLAPHSFTGASDPRMGELTQHTSGAVHGLE